MRRTMTMGQIIHKSVHKGGCTKLTDKELVDTKIESQDNPKTETMLYRNMLGLIKSFTR